MNDENKAPIWYGWNTNPTFPEAPCVPVCHTHHLVFLPLSLPIEARFDGPQLTSDGGLVWLAEADAALGLCATLGTRLREWRTGPVRHSLETLLRQRIFQIACGYEDQDDADTLRSDPLLKLVCGRVPTDPDLASQPTLSRLENAVDGKACYRLARALLEVYLQERARPHPPTHILIDADSTDDPTYGDQLRISSLAAV